MSQSTNIPRNTKIDAQQLQVMDLQIPKNILTEYQQLSESQRAGKISTSQRKRLLELTDIIENVEVKRYEKLMKLGKELKMTIPELKMKLGIGIHRSY